MTDRRVKECIIFNPETGISEDGTMHDGVYRPRINQPKKEQKMTREEAIEIIEENRLYYRDWKQGEFDNALERLKQPPTLADFLGWEEGVEYEWREDIFRIQSDILQAYDKEDEMWFDSSEELNDYLRLRQAKKVEKPKLKAYHVKDEYSYNCLMKELEEQGYVCVNGFPLSTIRCYKNKYPYVTEKENKKIMRVEKDGYNFYDYDLIEYHKEEPKYYAKIKGWELTDDDEVYFVVDSSGGGKEMFIGEKDCKRYSYDFYNEYTKSQWAELGIDEDNAEFEKVEVE